MTYDQWKCDSGYDEYEECYHEHIEIDFEGRAYCQNCSDSWWASEEEIAHQQQEQAIYDAWCRKQERREFWRKLTLPIRWPIFRLLERIWPRKADRVLTDDELPF